MLRVGLTGGVGSGKSSVANLFAELGIGVLDADKIAHSLYEPGQPAYSAVVAQFGEGILSNGRIDRVRLRERVYAKEADRRTLEAIIHPLVYQSLARLAGCMVAPYCIIAIPLLVETRAQGFVDRILVVDCHPEQQYERVRQRDGLDDRAIGLIVQAQASRRERLAIANDVIENTGEVGLLREQVENLHRSYLALAQEYP